MRTVSANSCRAAYFRGPSLSFPDILEDPMILDLMRADHVDTQALMKDLKQIAATITPAPEAAERDCSIH